MVGRVFGALTVVEHAGVDHAGKHIYSCLCSCGATKQARGTDIRNGNVRSCGHLRKAQWRA